MTLDTNLELVWITIHLPDMSLQRILTNAYSKLAHGMLQYIHHTPLLQHSTTFYILINETFLKFWILSSLFWKQTWRQLVKKCINHFLQKSISELVQA
jgi:hypothetical protein